MVREIFIQGWKCGKCGTIHKEQIDSKMCCYSGKTLSYVQKGKGAEKYY